MSDRNEQNPTGRSDEFEFPADEREKREREFAQVEENRRSANPQSNEAPARRSSDRNAGGERQENKYAKTVVKEKRNDPHDGGQDLDDPGSQASDGRQISSKTGKRSSAQKMVAARHKAAPMPAANPVAGA